MTTHAQRVETVCEQMEAGAAEHRTRTTATESELTIGRLSRQVERLRDALALKDEAITLLRDSLAESEAELDALRGRLAEQDGVAT